MGGEIGVDSQPGEGSTFWFTTTLIRQSRASSQLPSLPQADLRGRRILCVDNTKANLELLSCYSKDWGMECVTTTTPAEALNSLQLATDCQQPFDLAILDMHMPEMNGLELAGKIRALTTNHPFPLVLLTSIGRRGDGRQAQEAGFSGFVTKPIRKSQLFNCIATVIGLAHPDNEIRPAPLITTHKLNEIAVQTSSKILVVDDHSVNQQLAVLLLNRLGYRAEVAADGKEAMAAVTQRTFDVILMDCHMPEMDGYEATRAIRARENKGDSRQETNPSFSASHHPSLQTPSRVPIIAMTANAMKGDKEKCLEAGMDDYLTKPIQREELANALKKWLPTAGEPPYPAPETSLLSNPKDYSVHPKLEKNSEAKLHSVNVSVIREIQDLAGPERLRKIVLQFFQDAERVIQQVQQAVESKDAHQLQLGAHALKGICQNIGAEKLATRSVELEQIAREGISEAPPHLSEIRQEFKNVQTLIQKQFLSESTFQHSSSH